MSMEADEWVTVVSDVIWSFRALMCDSDTVLHQLDTLGGSLEGARILALRSVECNTQFTCAFLSLPHLFSDINDFWRYRSLRSTSL